MIEGSGERPPLSVDNETRRIDEGDTTGPLRSCVLLDKPYRRLVDVTIDYTGLLAPDAFIVGYGLDYQEKYRNLPYLARLEEWALES